MDELLKENGLNKYQFLLNLTLDNIAFREYFGQLSVDDFKAAFGEEKGKSAFVSFKERGNSLDGYSKSEALFIVKQLYKTLK